jgi:four helix bundle protein
MKELDIYKRCEDFAVSAIKFIEIIPYQKSVGVIGDQLMRSSCSAGANLCEADNARSRKEFVSCIGISLKEIKESVFWLRILKRINPEFQNLIQIQEKEAD